MVSLSFTNPEFLLLVLLVPVLAFSHRLFYKITKKHALLFSNFETLKRVRKNTKMRAHILVFISRLFVFILLILALAQPIVYYEADKQPTDYVIALDTSASMSAQDFVPSRFEAAKQFATGFVDSLGDQTRLGVIGFSGYPQVSEPLTGDSEVVRSAIAQLQLQTASGTDIAGAITTGTNLLIGSDQGRAIVLITDGSATTGQANEDSVGKALAYAREYEVTVHALGIGRAGSAPAGYLPRLYNVSAVYDEEQLTRITEETNGRLLRASGPEELEEALLELQEDPRSSNETYDPTFILLIVSLLLLFAEWVVMNSRLRIIP